MEYVLWAVVFIEFIFIGLWRDRAIRFREIAVELEKELNRQGANVNRVGDVPSL